MFIPSVEAPVEARVDADPMQQAQEALGRLTPNQKKALLKSLGIEAAPETPTCCSYTYSRDFYC